MVSSEPPILPINMQSKRVAPKRPQINHISFNQYQDCFGVGTESGFRICHSAPYKNTFFRRLEGGIGIVEMLFKSNIVGLVGGGPNPAFPSNRVVLWDDAQMKIITQFSFKTPVRGLKIRKDLIVIILDNITYVYNLLDFKLIDAIETASNPKGLGALSYSKISRILACPHTTQGCITVKIFNQKISTLISAHKKTISTLSLSFDGQLIASASIKGNTIRIFHSLTGQPLQDLRRGIGDAEIQSIVFHPTSFLVACSSDKHTIHIFELRKVQEAIAAVGYNESPKPSPNKSPRREGEFELIDKEEVGPQNITSRLSFMRKVLPKYFESNWGFTKFSLPAESWKICGFGQPNSLSVISMSGNYYEIEIPKDGNKCVLKKKISFLHHQIAN